MQTVTHHLAHRLDGKIKAVLAALFVALSAPAAAQETAKTGYEHARALFNEEKYAETIAFLDTYLRTAPRDARALVLRGDARANLGNDLEALKDYNAGLEADPNYQYAYLTRCETRLYLDQIDGALADCERAVDLDPTDEHAYEARGNARYADEAYGPALADFDKAITLGLSSAFIFGIRCDTHRLLGNLALAGKDCAHALILDPQNRRALGANGRLASREQRYSDVVAHFSPYIAGAPEDSLGGYYYRGHAYVRLKDYDAALADLRKFVDGDASDPDGYRERGLALFGAGDKAAALQDLLQAQIGYVRNGDQAEARRVGAMIDDINAGRAPVP